MQLRIMLLHKWKKRAATFRQRPVPTQTINQKQFVPLFIYLAISIRVVWISPAILVSFTK